MPDCFFLIDNNLFISLLARYENLNNFFQNINRLFEHRATRINFISTPFSFLESIGLNVRDEDDPEVKVRLYHLLKGIFTHISNIRSLPEELNTPKATSVLNEIIYDHIMGEAYKHFKNSQRFKVDNIMSQIQWIKGRIDSHQKCQELFVDNVEKQSRNKGFQDFIYSNLALDFLLRYDFDKFCIDPKNIHAGLMGILYRALSEKRNYSFFRLISKMFEYMHEHFMSETERSRFGPLLDILSIDDPGDLLDSELIHYSTVGYFYNSTNVKVYSFTKEREDVTKRRLEAYKTALNFLVANYS